MEINFPIFKNQHYWNTHYMYVYRIFEYLRCRYDIVNFGFSKTLRDFEDCNCFELQINNRNFLVNYNDNGMEIEKDGLIPLKFHWKKGDKGFSFPPISFYDWYYFYNVKDSIKYNPMGHISYRQRIYGNAKDRRTFILQFMKDSNLNIKTNILPQQDYWKDINNTILGIFVPGQNNNMLDRAQMQYMALGCPTISPFLPEILPFDRSFTPFMCLNDYSDLLKIIDLISLDKGVNELVEYNKKIFNWSCTPIAIFHWLEYILGETK